MPASRFLRMKRSVSLLVSDRDSTHGAIVEGTYQSPILVQWHRGCRQSRALDVTLTRFVTSSASSSCPRRPARPFDLSQHLRHQLRAARSPAVGAALKDDLAGERRVRRLTGTR